MLFQVSACVAYANLPQSKAGCLAKLRVKGEVGHLAHGGRYQELGLILQSIPTVDSP